MSLESLFVIRLTPEDGPAVICQLHNLHGGLVVSKVDQEGKPTGSPLMVLSVYISGDPSYPGDVKHVSVVTFTSEGGKLGYNKDPLQLPPSERVVVLMDLRNLGSEFMEDFFRPIDEDLRKPQDQREYFVHEPKP